MTDTIRGIVAYPVTPFSDEGGIDERAFRRVTENLLRSKPAAVAFLGSAGESAYLTEEEWRHGARLGVETVAGRTPVIVGVAELTTAAAVAKARYASEIGANMLMVIPVSYWKLTEAEIFDHYAAIATATDLPIMAYNNPGTSGVDMSPEFLVRLVRELPTVRFIKESSGDLNRMHAIYKLSNGTIPFYNGANHMALEAIAAGAAGWCTAAPNLLDDRPARLFELVQAGDIARARALFYEILPVLRFIVFGGLPTTVKAGLALRGLPAGAPRPPLKPLVEAELRKLAEYLAELKVGPIPA
ncbi:MULTISPECIES: dihydrodipicolinate synthase family protein [Methylosinus]|uniref:Dihydrodipicolinate synthase family protein n=1 Tax=Methylosinus trichosporium (strain ATCC 35070 / NCIMB 11131 / UNIQEM 75 / OB3b) TaxID=595536 RepID=A0A2D2D274_METT3|nr:MULTISPECIES: dihydrodipicolinate synthase family protein [Methylosinus]ATQ69103.1 dihydrodipicolinate synthase family protein [Methylosinus trichosporium OB3b]OBS54224.1 dihydrodipicolinate synthase family protein [Methylosinus sp. 3S-1]